MLCALIMAGGKGERFWPLSTEEKPKQFLNLVSDDTMIQMTVKRLEKLVPLERIFVVTGKMYIDLVKEQLPEIPSENIIVEPVGKNTAPCIALSAFIIEKYYKDAVIAVVPSDHLIEDEDKFIEILKEASEFVETKEEAVVTIGIKPDRPETGYGYIQYSKNQTNINNSILKVERFVEKPQYEKAKEYINAGNFLWNAGMFVWKSSTILKLTKQYLLNTYNILSEIAISSDENYEETLEEKYKDVDSVSVDYGIMEKSQNIFVIPGEFGWDDIGNWTSMERYNEKDENGNINQGNFFSYKSKNNIVLSDKKVLLNNVKDLIIVETDEYILVSSKFHEQEIKAARLTMKE